VLPFRPTLPLATERLRLRAFTLDDVDALYDLRSREDVVRWLYHEPFTPADAAAYAAKRAAALELAADGDAILLAAEARDTGALVGDCMLRLLSAEHRGGEIGYIVHPDHQGNGYATEMARELLRAGFEEAGLHRLIARCEPRNTASAAVMERLGMRREAHLVENEWVKGEWQGELVYALLEREWQSAAPGEA
jgi:RimJ/RimL family protein N-acetyltransferase